jgi:hypothetical protein
MTAFFVPDTPPGKETTRRYEDLRDYAEHTSGRTARPARIFKLSYRCADAGDVETAVGTSAVSRDAIVHAIFDVGDAYAILSRGGHEIVTKRQTYVAHEFD